jgi:Uma2 family endonuclease
MSTNLAPASRRRHKEFLLELLPDQGEWTEDEYLWLTDRTSRLVELTDGYLEVLPMPTDRHQSILAYVFLLFNGFVTPKGGKVQFAGLRLRLKAGKFREPDLLLLLDAKDPRRQDRFWTGADLVLEVVSKDNPQRDLEEKRHDYSQAGIPEYWIVNPLTETILVYRLKGRKYPRAVQSRRGARASSAVLSGFSVDVADVFEAD